jgi:hypothetical protein
MNACISSLALLTLFTSIEHTKMPPATNAKASGTGTRGTESGGSEPWDDMADLEYKTAPNEQEAFVSSSLDLAVPVPAALTQRRPSKESTASELSGDSIKPAKSIESNSYRASRDSDLEIREIPRSTHR